MPSGASQITSQVESPASSQSADVVFFEAYADLSARTRLGRKPGDTINVFHRSREKFEQRLLSAYANKKNGVDPVEIPAYHAILSLIHWLYPNYIGYNRLKNATTMYRQAGQAVLTSEEGTLTFILGVFIQLRILPFLIRSKKASVEQLSQARQAAISFLSKESDRTEPESGIKGLTFEGLGFSYYQYERDKKAALAYLTKSVEHFASANKKLSSKSRTNGTSSPGQMLRAEISFYRSFTAVAYCDLGICYESETENAEGGEMFSLLELTRNQYTKAFDYAKRTPWHYYKGIIDYNLSGTYAKEGQNQIERKKAIQLLKKAVSLGDESLRWLALWSPVESDFLGGSWIATFYQQLADYSDGQTRRKLMAHSLKLARKAEQVVSDRRMRLLRYSLVNLGDIFFRNAEYYRKVAMRIEGKNGSLSKKADLLGRALSNCLKGKTFYKEERYSNRSVDASLLVGDICYELLGCDLAEGDISYYSKLAKRLCNNSVKLSKRLGWNERVAEANWLVAQILDKEGKFEGGSLHYLKAHNAYELAQNSTAKSSLYLELANYMLAWNRIEQAKAAHRASDFGKASKLYAEASELALKTKGWNRNFHLHMAESLIEQGEKESLEDNTQDSIESFNEAIQSLSKYIGELKEENASDVKASQELAIQLTAFCKARAMLEKSKESYKIGDLNQSVHGLSGAESIFRELAESPIISDSLRANELASLASLCAAMRSFQKAQLTGESRLYLEAKEIFSSAASASKSKSLCPMLSGLASFAAFLYFSKEIESSLDTSLNVERFIECNKALDYAEVMFRKLGNKSFLSMMKASKHILDATVKMNAAEREMERASVRAKLYSQAQRSLTLASKYYQLLGSSRRVKESLRMIGAVRNHRRLMPLAHDIIAEIASNQIIYTAISSSSVFEQSPENSARMLDTAYIVLDLKIPKTYITTEDKLNLGLTLSNMGKGAAITVKIEEVIPEGFEIVQCTYPVLKDRALSINVRIEAGVSKQISLVAKSSSSGEFTWHPSLVYLDSARNYKMTKAQTVKVVVESGNTIDFANLIIQKQQLEEQLENLQKQIEKASQNEHEELIEQVYVIKEKVSKIEEELLRTKNEFEKLSSDLENIRTDMASLNVMQNDAIRAETHATLEAEEKLLLERIQRRRSLLEQAHLL